MPDTQRSPSDAAAGLFDKLGSVPAGMHGVEGSGAHMQPMIHFADAERASLWFITPRKTDLARHVGQGATAQYGLVDADQGFYACLRGAIRQSKNAGKVDALWSPVVAAWFTGCDDPDALSLDLSLRDAAIWEATGSGVQFGLEIARANLVEGSSPDIGTHQTITF